MDWDFQDLTGQEAYHLLCAAVSPRPIGWIRTRSQEGEGNLAPFSWFQALCKDPPLVTAVAGYYPDGSPKDTLVNLQGNPKAQIVIPRGQDQDAVQASGEPVEGDEARFGQFGVTPEGWLTSNQHIILEVVLRETHAYGEAPTGTTQMVFEVLRMHCPDHLVAEGRVRIQDYEYLSRLGSKGFSTPA